MCGKISVGWGGEGALGKTGRSRDLSWQEVVGSGCGVQDTREAVSEVGTGTRGTKDKGQREV